MATTPTAFTDRLGRAWTLTLAVSDLKPLAEVFGCPPKQVLADPDQLTGFLADPERIVAAACVLARPADDVTPEGFAAGFDADALEAAAGAVIRVLAGFYGRGEKGRAAADRIIEALRLADRKTAEAIAAHPIDPDDPAAA